MNLISFYHKGYKEGYEAGQEKGRNEAWEVAGKLVSMEYGECNEVLGESVSTIETNEEIFTRYTASEAIEKLCAYEEQKKEDLEFHIGDEVQNDSGVRKVVVGSFKSADGSEFISIMGTDFKVPQIMPKEDYKKTGRYFPEIVEVLNKLREGA